MQKIPTQLENTTGLHERYKVSKYKVVESRKGVKSIKTVPVDKGSEYFVMRLDERGKDREHIKACRIAVQAYATAIAHHLPELANDIMIRYPLL